MKFYNREKELAQLDEIRHRAFTQHSQMTVITGRRRIGKTKLILHSCRNTPTVYLFVSHNNEATLCDIFAATIKETLGMPMPSKIQSFVDLFAQLMLIGRLTKFNLVIDEFQELLNINPAIFSGMQDVWDRNKDVTHVNFIASGSIHSLMHHIFMDYREPLYGRCDTVMRIRPFTTSVLTQIMDDYAPGHTNDDVLALYAITGGVPKYVEMLMDRGALTVQTMIRRVTEENSIFLEEGHIMLSQEFGKKYGNYFSILSAIAAGRNTLPQISQEVGGISVGGMLSRLEEDYELIKKKRPILSKERSKNVRYEIADNFLRFWFRYVARNQNLLQMDNNQRLYEIVLNDYPTYSGLILEKWFRQKMKESHKFDTIGGWWNTTKGTDEAQDEIDIVALNEANKSAVVAEVKRQAKNYKPDAFQSKIQHLVNKVLHGYEITPRLLTLEDM